mmetsp:Transcript_79445/g.177656  ORF Transcript_79445/g.177656 Transcript_79445/m.177656 type:complete len:321 (+) Transcript_79445:584-1546(+)
MSSVSSSTRLQIDAPETRAMRLLSVFLTLRMQEQLAFRRKCCAKSEMPFSVITTSGFTLRMSSHIFLISSSSCIRSFSQSASFVISTLVWLSPFLYSRGQSRSTTRGFLISLRILGCVMSLLNMTPSSTSHWLRSPPDIFSTLAKRLMSISFLPSDLVTHTVCAALRAKSEIRFPQRLTNFVSMAPRTMSLTASALLMSTGFAIPFKSSSESSSAFMYPETMSVGCIFFSRSGSATPSISPARMITEVVPSPTSSSCARLSSIMFLAAGCETSTSLRMALPSLVMTMPPIGSSSILSMARGPSVVRTMPATVLPAWMFVS